MKIEEIVNEGPMSKALGTAAVAGAVGLAGNGAYHLSKLNDITAQQPAAKVAQAPAQKAKDLSTIQAKKGKDQMERDYQPITNHKNEMVLASVAQKHGIQGLELAAFMAQMAHESWGFKDMVENGDNWKKYGEGKLADTLGNKNMNDAERFKGRGFIQLTGRWNYTHYGKKLGLDLVSSWSNAQQAADPTIAAEIAVQFWKDRVQGKVNDFANVEAVTRPINPKLNGIDDRESKFYQIANNMGLDV